MSTLTQTQALVPWRQSTDSPGIIYDLFPTTVRTPTAYYEKVRIILTTGSPGNPTPMLYVFLDGPQGPGAVLEARYDPSHIYGDTRAGLDVYAGIDRFNPNIASVIELRPMANCGCGSRLKGSNFHPFTTMRHSSPPPSGWPAARPARACSRPAAAADSVPRHPRPRYPVMALLLWIIAVVLVISGVISLVRREWVLGAVLIVAGLLVGPGGVSIFT